MNSQQKKLYNLLKKYKLTLSAAESCTGGKLSNYITDIPGISEFFKGSLIAYSNETKKKVLDVSEYTLKKYGAVSLRTVFEMASNCCQLFNTDLSVAISGIAGPGGGALRKPVGTVFICTYFKNRLAAKKHNFSGTRIQIKKQSVFTAIDSLIGHIESQVKNSL